jgi:hypothetical protein
VYAAEQLTIFYGGKVVVVDNFPSTQVKALLQMANAAGDDGAADKAGSGGEIAQGLLRPAHENLPAGTFFLSFVVQATSCDMLTEADQEIG